MSDSGLSNDAYGHTVSMTTDGVTDLYCVGGAVDYAFPVGTDQGVVYLSIAIQSNLLMAKGATQDYILSKYSRDQQIQFLAMYEAAVRASLTNRAAYIAQLLTWLSGIIAYLASYVASVQALTDPAVVAATQLDLTRFPPDPGVTMLAAIQIGS